MHKQTNIIRSFFILAFALVASALYSQTSFEQIAKPDATVEQLIAIHKNRPHSDTYYLLALAAARKADYIQAEKEIRTGLQINPANIRLINLKGAILARQGHLAMARRIFLSALQLEPRNKYANLSLHEIEKQLSPKTKLSIRKAVAKSTNDKPEQPISPVKVATRSDKTALKPGYFVSIKDKQRCFYNMRMLENAYERSVALNPANKDKFVLNDFVAQKLIPSVPICPDGGQYTREKGEIVCSKHGKMTELGAEVETVFAEFNKGMRYKLTRNYLDALKSFEQVVVLYPMWAEAHYQLGDTLFRVGETDASIKEIRECLKSDNDNVDAILLLANLYYKKGQKQAALKLLNSVMSKHKGTVYSLAAKSIAKSIKAGRNYYQVFPPN